MKLSRSVLQAVLAGAVAFNGAFAFAETTQTVVEIQRANLLEIKNRFDELNKKQASLKQYNTMFAQAQKAEAGWKIDLQAADQANTYGMLAVVPATGFRYFMSIKPDLAISRVATKPTNVAIIVAGLAIGGGYLVKRNATVQLNISEAQRQEALANIEQIKGLIESEKALIVALSKNAGAKVENKIISFEGLPDSLKFFNGPNNSMMMLQD